MTTNTVSKALGIPVRDVLKMIHAGKLPAVKVGGRWKIFDEDFQRWEGRSMKRAIPYTAAIAEQKPAGQIKMPEPAPKLDLDDVVERLLPFEGRDFHSIWPVGGYDIGLSVELSDVWEAQLTPIVVGNTDPIFCIMCGNREQAIEFCRADLKIRLRAVLDLMGVGK